MNTTTVAAPAPRPEMASLFARKPLDRGHMTDAKRFAANEEPSLSELLSDPMVRSLMDSDGVAEDCLSSIIHRARSRLAIA